MVFDTRGMVQHYKRIYNAKPSPEIARTRASSANKRRPRPGSSSSGLPPRRTASFQSLNQESVWFNNGTNSRQGDWSDAEWLAATNGSYDRFNFENFSDISRQQQQQQQRGRRPFSASVERREMTVNEPSNRIRNVEPDLRRNSRPYSANVLVTANVASRKQDLRPKRRRLRPASTNGHYQSSSSAAEDVIPRLQRANSNPYSKLPFQQQQQQTAAMKKYSSMHDLQQHPVRGPPSSMPQRIYSSTSMDQVGMRHATSLSERIDTFLDAVHQEEEQQLLLQQQQQLRQQQIWGMRGGRQMRTSSNRPSMSSVISAGNVSSRKASSTAFSVSSLPSRHKYQIYGSAMKARPTRELPRPPQPRQSVVESKQPDPRALARPMPTTRLRRPGSSGTFTHAKQSVNSRRKAATPAPAPIDTNNVVSKLKQDRNYQPPRQKKTAAPENNNNVGQNRNESSKQRQQSSSDNGDDYEEDFEAEEDGEEEEEDDTDTAMMRKKQAWLYDQFRRVSARQRAAVIVKRQESGAEKASSKDSAYGYSGGETSRLHTREPTPDYQPGAFPRHHHRDHRPGLKQRILPSSSSSKIHHSTLATRQRGVPLVPKHALTPPQGGTTESGINEDYIKFLSSVTNEILKSGNFTVPSIKRLIEQHLANNKGKYNLSKREVEELTVTLRQELGLEPAKDQFKSNIRKGIQEILRTPSTTSTVLNKQNVIRYGRQQQQQTSTQHRTSNHNVIHRTGSQQHQQQNIKINISRDEGDEDEEELMLRLLRDETDLDDSTVEEIIRAATTTTTTSNQPSPSHYRKQQLQQHQQQPSTPSKKSAAVAEKANVTGLFKSLNISNLDVSFNASFSGQMKKREELNAEKALLIKSFALQGKERTIRARNEENNHASSTPPPQQQQQQQSNRSPKVKAKISESKSPLKLKPKIQIRDEEENLTPRSSMLYQTDDESKGNDEVSEEIRDDDDNGGDSETIGDDESVAEDLRASS